MENLTGVVVGLLSADDQDSGQLHTFQVANPQFEIVNNELRLKEDQSLNLDQGMVSLVDLTVTDSGTPPESFTQTLVLDVLSNPRPWRYWPQPFDTNADGSVVPLDVLRLINQLNIPTILDVGGKLPRSAPAKSTLPFYDVNGDGFCTTNDILQIVNFLNRPVGEGESFVSDFEEITQEKSPRYTRLNSISVAIAK